MRWKRPGGGSPRLALFFHGYWNATLAYDIPMADCEEGDGPKNGTCFGDGQEGFEEDVRVQSHGLTLW